METNQERRRLVKKLAYIPPTVLTLSAMPFSASYGSGNSVGPRPIRPRPRPWRPIRPRVPRG